MHSTSQQLVLRQGILLLLCVYSDVLPRTLGAFLDSHSAIWTAVIDSASHAGIASASWAVAASLSYVGGNPPPGACQVALSGSPVHRCMSCVLERIRGRTNATSSPRVATREKRAELLRKHPNEASVSTIVPPVQQRPPSTVSGCERWWREEPLLKEMIFAGCFGSALDVDHFLAAGSLRLSRAIRVSGRPWGHSVAALLAMTLAVLMLTHNRRAGAIVLVAGTSHQLRDAIRRGLWLYPPMGPRTPPLWYPLYLLAQVLLPLVVALCLRWHMCFRLGRYITGVKRRRRRIHSGDRVCTETVCRNREEIRASLVPPQGDNV